MSVTRTLGTALQGVNFECGFSRPLDARQVVNTLADLKAANYQAVYIGLVVAVIADGANNGLYVLQSVPVSAVYTPAEWQKVGTGGGTGTIDDYEGTVGFNDDALGAATAQHVSINTGTNQVGNVDIGNAAGTPAVTLSAAKVVVSNCLHQGAFENVRSCSSGARHQPSVDGATLQLDLSIGESGVDDLWDYDVRLVGARDAAPKGAHYVSQRETGAWQARASGAALLYETRASSCSGDGDGWTVALSAVDEVSLRATVTFANPADTSFIDFTMSARVVRANQI